MNRFWKWLADYANSKLPVDEQRVELIGNPYEAIITHARRIYKPVPIEPGMQRDIIMIDKGRQDIINLIGKLRDKGRPM